MVTVILSAADGVLYFSSVLLGCRNEQMEIRVSECTPHRGWLILGLIRPFRR